MRKSLIVAATIAATLFTAPAEAHIPEQCHDLAAELVATERNFIEPLEALAEAVFARMPMFMIEHAMAEFTSALVARTLAEERLTKCIVGAEQ